MQVKIFESTDMASGLKLVKKELGPDALILSTRTIRNGKLGILGKNILEITAAVDTPWPKNKGKENEGHPPSMPPPEHQAYVANSGRSSSNSIAADPPTSPADTLYKIGKKPDKFQHSSNRDNSVQENPQLRREFDDLKYMVRTLADQISRLDRNSEPTAGHSSLSGLGKTAEANSNNRRAELAPVIDLLLSIGVDPKTTETISGFAEQTLNPEDLQDRGRLLVFIRDTISDIIEVHPPDFTSVEKQHTIALVGSTGVGKTTTLAKIAANYLSNYSNSIALITIDTYRIAAIEQLKVYGEIMHLPVDVVLTPLQLEQAMEKHRDKDLILIDTAGRSPRDTLSIDELHSFLDPIPDITKHLVLSATNREDELAETIARFSRLGIDSTIFTKVDECVNLGIILNTQIHNSAPVSYITNGQRVPEDLVAADKKEIAELIIPIPQGRLHDYPIQENH